MGRLSFFSFIPWETKKGLTSKTCNLKIVSIVRRQSQVAIWSQIVAWLCHGSYVQHVNRKVRSGEPLPQLCHPSENKWTKSTCAAVCGGEWPSTSHTGAFVSWTWSSIMMGCTGPRLCGKLLTHYHTRTPDHLSSNPECHLFFIYQSITINYVQWKFKQSPFPLLKPVNYSVITNKSGVVYPFPSHSQTGVWYNMNFRGNA